MRSRKTGIILSYLNTFLNMVSGLFLSAYLIRMLGAQEYGVYQTVASFANYLVMLQFGTGTVMTRNIAMCSARHAPQEEIDRNVNAIWSLACILSALIVVVGIGFYTAIDEIYVLTMDAVQQEQAKTIFLYVMLHLISSFLLQTLNGVALAYEYYGYASIQNIFRTVMKTAVLAAWVFQSRRAVHIAQTDALISVVLLIVSGLCITRWTGIHFHLKRPDRSVMAAIAPLCLALFLQTIVNQANNNVDKFLIGVLLSTESVSVYSVAMYIFSIFSSMTTIPISMYAPMVAKEIQRGTEMERLEYSLVAPCRLTAIIGGMIYFGFIAAGREFICAVYGEYYMTAWGAAVVIMAPMYINMITGTLVNILDALNKRMIRSLILIGTTVMNILLTVFWLRRWGIMGAAMATAISTLIGQVLIMNLYYIKRIHINIRKLLSESMRGILIWFAVACFASMAAGNFADDQLVSMMIRIATFLVVWICGFLWKGASDEEKHMIQKICHWR